MCAVYQLGIFWVPESLSFVGEGVWTGYICLLNTTLGVLLVGLFANSEGQDKCFQFVNSITYKHLLR